MSITAEIFVFSKLNNVVRPLYSEYQYDSFSCGNILGGQSTGSRFRPDAATRQVGITKSFSRASSLREHRTWATTPVPSVNGCNSKPSLLRTANLFTLSSTCMLSPYPRTQSSSGNGREKRWQLCWLQVLTPNARLCSINHLYVTTNPSAPPSPRLSHIYAYPKSFTWAITEAALAPKTDISNIRSRRIPSSCGS